MQKKAWRLKTMTEDIRPRCAGKTKAGEPCKNYALEGEAFCRVHMPEPTHETTKEERQRLRAELNQELDELVTRLRELRPDYTPPPFSPEAMIALIRRNLPGLPAGLRLGVADKLRESLDVDVFDVETWKGLWYMLNYSAQYQADFVKRRFTGEYETDEWGLDWEFVEVIRPFFEFMYYKYFRVQTTGLENVPDMGRTLLVSNHSGQLPWDGAMVTTAIYCDHPAQRLSRSLYATWFPTLPFFSTILERGGQVMATVDNGTRLLEQDELVAVFPEGYKGVGKLFKDRYKLARFGRGGFVKMALNTQAPMIPVSVVGAEETYVSVYKSQTLAKLTGFPFFPISLRFPWLGLLGFVPFPTKWFIDFGEPISTDIYEPDAAQNLVLVSQLSDQVRNIVQEMIYKRLAQRRSVFFG
jgi:1-acyl-sn-glycerol-3-phosphate acyltransferase